MIVRTNAMYKSNIRYCCLPFLPAEKPHNFFLFTFMMSKIFYYYENTNHKKNIEKILIFHQ